MESRTCKTCGVEQELTENFRNHFIKGKWYREYECRACGRDRARKRYRVDVNSSRAKDRENYQKNAATIRTRKLKDYWNNRENNLKRNNAYRKAHLDRDAKASREYRKRNPEYTRLHSKKQRAQKRNAKIGVIRVADIHAIRKRQKGKCAVCAVKLDKHHIDHIMPLARGGTHAVANLQLLCPPCNLSKSGKHPVDFMQERGFLL